jgi:phosphoenolpyruvate carboxykinase (GTP)
MAMLPFCGYNMADYWGHWLDIGKRLTQPPKIFRINWFRRDGAGRFLWPGYGENLRVLQWIVERCRDRGKAEETAIGYRPAPGAIDTAGLSLAPGARPGSRTTAARPSSSRSSATGFRAGSAGSGKPSALVSARADAGALRPGGPQSLRRQSSR